MISIFSFDYIEEPTNDVMEWLRFYNKKFIRINGDDVGIDSNYFIDFEKKWFKNDKTSFKFKEIKSVFYRRWYRSNKESSLYNQFIKNEFDQDDVKLVNYFNTFLISEYQSSIHGFFDRLNEAKWYPYLNNIKREPHKLEVLNIVEKNGIKVPPSIITTNKSDVLVFKNKHKEIIVKPIKDMFPIIYKNYEVNMHTKLITTSSIDDMPENFFPTIFQKKIEKLFEVRSFFIDNDFYSMMIFSQQDKKTTIDFRNYNLKKPNRYVPYKLPKEIKSSIIKSMKELKINTGSIDLIFTPKGEYYFLEVNIVGQLGMVSSSCSYYIEEKIAKKLEDGKTEK